MHGLELNKSGQNLVLVRKLYINSAESLQEGLARIDVFIQFFIEKLELRLESNQNFEGLFTWEAK